MSNDDTLATASRERGLDGTCCLLKTGTFAEDGSESSTGTSSAHEDRQGQQAQTKSQTAWAKPPGTAILSDPTNDKDHPNASSPKIKALPSLPFCPNIRLSPFRLEQSDWPNLISPVSSPESTVTTGSSGLRLYRRPYRIP